MAFPKTRHSAILGLRDDDAAVRRDSMETVARAYWEPVQRYLSFRWREDEDDAADLTQAFFSRSIESGTLARFDPAKGLFRTYLRSCLDNFVRNARDRTAHQTVPLDMDVPAADDSPDEIFHREWVRKLFRLAVEHLRANRDDVRFQIFERYDLNDAGPRPTYEELAVEFGVSAMTVTNYLAAMRRDFRKSVLHLLRELTVNEREFRAEARAILGIEP